LSDPFPKNFPIALPSSALAYQRNLRTAYTQHWNMNVQQEIGRGRMVEAAYAGSKGTKLLGARDLNQPLPSARQPNPRPVPQFDDIDILESRGNSSYHSLQARFQQSFQRGLTALASYTWSKSIDDASSFFSSAGDANYPQDSRNTRAESAHLQFRVEAFNLLNHANLGLPDIFVGSPSFGSIQSAGSPRRLQFGIRILF